MHAVHTRHTRVRDACTRDVLRRARHTRLTRAPTHLPQVPALGMAPLPPSGDAARARPGNAALWCDAAQHGTGTMLTLALTLTLTLPLTLTLTLTLTLAFTLPLPLPLTICPPCRSGSRPS